MVFGLMLGLTAVTVDGVQCGSAFTGGYLNDLTNTISAPGFPAELCGAARDARRVQALALLIPGVVALLAGSLMGYNAWMRTPVRGKPQRTGSV